MAVFTNTNQKVHTPPLRLEALLPAGARWSALAWQGAAAVTGAVLGAGQIYGGAAPFGLALVIGCPPAYLLASGVGALAGSLLFQPVAMGLKLAGGAGGCRGGAAAQRRQFPHGGLGRGPYAAGHPGPGHFFWRGASWTLARPSPRDARPCWRRESAGRFSVFRYSSRAGPASGWRWGRPASSAVPSDRWLRAWHWRLRRGSARPSPGRWSRRRYSASPWRPP